MLVSLKVRLIRAEGEGICSSSSGLKLLYLKQLLIFQQFPKSIPEEERARCRLWRRNFGGVGLLVIIFSRVISRMSFSAHYFHVEDVGRSARSFEVWRRHLMQGREDAMQHKRNAAETQSTDLGNTGLGATKIHNDGG